VLLIRVEHGLPWLRSQPDAEINLANAPRESRHKAAAPIGTNTTRRERDLNSAALNQRAPPA
jgi:hypothetical protein